GLRASAEPIEAIGIGRARAALEESPIALWVVDGSAPLAPEDRWIAEKLRGKRVLAALNKRDLPASTPGEDVWALLDGAAGNGDGGGTMRDVAPDAGVPARGDGRRGARGVELAEAREGSAVRVVAVSAARREGLDELRAALASLLGADG